MHGQIARGMLAYAGGDIGRLREERKARYGDPRDQLCFYHGHTGEPAHWYGFGFRFGEPWDPAAYVRERAERDARHGRAWWSRRA